MNTIILIGAMIAPIPRPYIPPVVNPPVTRVRPYVPYVAPNPIIIPPSIILPNLPNKKHEKDEKNGN